MIFAGIMDLFAVLFIALVATRAQARTIFTFCAIAVSFSSIFTISLIKNGSSHDYSKQIAILNSINRFGVQAGLMFCYILHPKLFPTLFVGTSMGIAHFFKGMANSVGPILAEMDQPAPQISILACAMGWLLITQYLEEDPQEKKSGERPAEKAH
mmetsp:Transcript_6724/g.7808  ORF Transcript_6724/g.7808 Transcript_6724/m.7808 type:complete len:155 (+) Transcript_6724:2-466(+)